MIFVFFLECSQTPKGRASTVYLHHTPLPEWTAVTIGLSLSLEATVIPRPIHFIFRILHYWCMEILLLLDQSRTRLYWIIHKSYTEWSTNDCAPSYTINVWSDLMELLDPELHCISSQQNSLIKEIKEDRNSRSTMAGINQTLTHEF